MQYCTSITFVPEIQDGVYGVSDNQGNIIISDQEYSSTRMLHEFFHLQDFFACGRDYCSNSDAFVKEWQQYAWVLPEQHVNDPIEAWARIKLYEYLREDPQKPLNLISTYKEQE